MADAIDIFTREVRASRVDAPECVDTAAIEAMEALLERMKAGDITSFMFVGGTVDENTVTAWSASAFNEPFVFLGRLEAAKHEVAMSLYQDTHGTLAHYEDFEED